MMKKTRPLRIFISYSRRDSAIADAVVLALESRGFHVKIDQRDLPFGEKWQNELAGFIREADTVIWLVSAHSIASKWCNWELDEVIKKNKRLVPVMVGEVVRSELPRQLGEIHILPPDGLFEFERDLDALTKALERDQAWLKEHTRLADSAREWLARNRTSSVLLRGAALADAEKWEREQPPKAPTPASEILELILASRQAATRRQRYWVGGSMTVAIGAIGLAGLAYLQSIEADRQRTVAEEQRKVAVVAQEAEAKQRRVAEENERRAQAERDRALTSQSQFLAQASVSARQKSAFDLSLLLALEALPDSTISRTRPIAPSALEALYQSIWSKTSAQNSGDTKAQFRPVLTLERGQFAEQIVFSSTGRYLVLRLPDRPVRLYDALTGAILKNLGSPHGVSVVKFSPSDKYLALGRISELEILKLDDPKLGVVNLVGHRFNNDPNNARPFGLDNPNFQIAMHAIPSAFAIDFSLDDRFLAAAPSDQPAVQVWDLDEEVDQTAPGLPSKSFHHVGSYGQHINAVQFLLDGTRIIAWTGENKAHLWAVAGKWTPIASFDGAGLKRASSREAFLINSILRDAKDGRAILDGRLLQNSYDPEFLPIGPGDSNEFTTMKPGFLVEQHPLIAGDPFDLVVLDRADPANIMSRLRTKDGRGLLDGRSVVSPNGERIAVVLEDGRVRLWDWKAGKIINDPMKAGEFIETLARFSGDSTRLILGALSEDDMARIHPNHQAGRGYSKRARIIDASTGAEVARLPLDRPISNVAISHNGKLALTADRLGKVVLWNATDGTIVSELGELGTKVIGLTFFGGDNGIRAVSEKGIVQIWSRQSGSSTTSNPSETGGQNSSACSPRVEYSIEPLGSRDGYVTVTDAVTGQEAARLGGAHQGFVKEAHSSPDGKRVVSIDGTGVIRLWDPSSGKLLSELNVATSVGYFESASFMGFTNDCRFVLSHDKAIKLWSAETGGLVRELGPSKGNEVGADLHLNGDWLALVRRSDQDIRAEGYEVDILRIKDGLKIRLPDRFARRPRLRFSASGNLVVSFQTKDNTEFFFSAGLDGAVERGKKLIERCMLDSERSQYFLPPEPPEWCITGPGNERKLNRNEWKPLYPFQSAEWADWLEKRLSGQ